MQSMHMPTLCRCSGEECTLAWFLIFDSTPVQRQSVVQTGLELVAKGGVRVQIVLSTCDPIHLNLDDMCMVCTSHGSNSGMVHT